MQTGTANHRQSAVQEMECPVCHATIPVDPNYVSWCDRCEWNLQPQEPAPPRNVFEASYASIGRRASKNLFDRMVRTTSLRPTLTFSKVLAFLVAAVVHGLTLLFAGLSIFLLVRGWPNFMAIIGGLFCGGLAWALRPRFPRAPREIMPRDQFPTLYKLVDNIAQALRTASVDGIVIDEDFNAAFGQVGWRQKKILFLGLPLLSILDHREKTALIGHELAHGTNGDPLRGFFIRTAVNSLVEWHRILHPDEIWDSTAGIEGLLMIPINVALIGVSYIPWLGAYALSHLIWHDSQRAEYLADYLASAVSGTDAMLSMLEKLHYQRTFSVALQRTALSRSSQNFFDELRQQVAAMPKREVERIRRVEQLELSRLDTTHPPTAYRVRFLSAHRIEKPEVVFSPVDFEELDRELASVQGSIQKELVDQYKTSLYE